MIKILFIGDIVGPDGLNLCCDMLPLLKRDLKYDICIANGENSDMGKGISKKQASKLHQCGVDVITGGNHSFQKSGSDALSDPTLTILRPANYPDINPGIGHLLFTSKAHIKFGIINLQGRGFLPPINCPFDIAEKLVEKLKQETKYIFIDFHAETTAEKQALAWHLDGKISALVGTHTHVQTADERILHKGTAYITDVGMTGPADSVIGMDIPTAILRFKTQLPKYFKMATRNIRMNAVMIHLDENTGKAKSINRLNFARNDYEQYTNS